MTCDMYLDLGLKDIIKILGEKDCKRLAHTSYSTDGIEIPSDLSYNSDGDLYHDFDIYYGKVSEKSLPSLLYFQGGGLFMRLRRFLRSFVFLLLRGGKVVNKKNRRFPRVTLKIHFE